MTAVRKRLIQTYNTDANYHDDKVRINVGAGSHPMEGWVNIDQDPSSGGIDLVADGRDLPYDDGEVEAVYAGHCLEHLTLDEGLVMLKEFARVVRPGGTVGILVPDIREVFRRYLAGTSDIIQYQVHTPRLIRDMRTINDIFVYNHSVATDEYDSPHRAAYDAPLLVEQLRAAGLEPVAEIDRYDDPRVPVGEWYQFGFDCEPTEED